MRAQEFIAETKRSPIISLKHINKLKKIKLARIDAHDKRKELYSVMYSDPSHDLQHLELQKARIEVAQQMAELALIQSEAEQANKETVANMAQSGIETRLAKQEKVNDMAMRAIGRRKEP